MVNPVLRLVQKVFGSGDDATEEEAAPRYQLEDLGLSDETVQGFDAEGFIDSDRRKELEFRARYFRCDQHDWKTFDFDGRLTGDGPAWSRQRLWGATQAAFFVPFDQRRPSAPYRLGRKIVQDLTDLVFGHGQFPQIRVLGDPDREDWVQAVVKELRLQVNMGVARNRGGSCGTVGLSWHFVKGRPRMSVHAGSNLHVHAWEDRDERRPSHVTELYQYAKDVRDERGKLERKWFWYRRDWTAVADVYFKPVEVDRKQAIQWEVDEEQTRIHNDGRCHFVWILNMPDDDATSDDGQPDYAEQYEDLDAVDQTNSVVFTGSKKNLDPTLVIASKNEVGMVKKGSDNAITPGEGGQVSYLELAGTSLNAGISLVKELRGQILEVAQVVSPDPDKVAGQGTSSVALKMMYRPMLSRCDIFRVQYGAAIVELLTQIVQSAEKLESETVSVWDEAYGEEVEVTERVVLPPRMVESLVTDPETGAPEVDPTTGQPTNRTQWVAVERRLGQGGEIELVWPDYFKPGPDDYQKTAQALTAANGGKPLLSQQTSVETYASLAVVDPAEEWKRILQEGDTEAAKQETMFPPAGHV